MDEVGKTLNQLFVQITSLSNRVLEVGGLDEHFHAAADTLYSYPVNTMLLCVHFSTLIFKIRTSEGIYFASSNPFGSLLSSVILCFAGSIIQNLLLGIPIVKSFENTSIILLVALIWYLVFFSAWDLFTKLIVFWPVRIILIILKEVYRVKCIMSGVKLAASHFPEAWMVIIAIGSIRGCGSMVLKPFVHQIVGLGAATIEFHRPSFTTKISIVISCVFSLQVKNVIGVSLASTSLIFTELLIVFQFLFLLSSQSDPFVPLENTLAGFIFRHPKQQAAVSGNENKKKSD